MSEISTSRLSRRHLLGGAAAGAAVAGIAPFRAADAASAAEVRSFVGETFDGYINDRGGQVFNVTNPAYGAKGDGVADDTAAINAAITAAGASGTVLLPAGVYRITAPITHNGRGGIIGRGGYATGTAGGNTVLLCGTSTAGLILNGCARYESFMVDGNGIATLPLRNGTIANNAVTATQAHATYLDVWVANAAGTGWSVYGARHNAYYDCGSVDNKLDGLYIDGGAQSLEFFHFHESGNLRHGIRGNHVVTSASGSTKPTEAIRFHSGSCQAGGGRPPGVSKVHLRGARDWAFPDMVIDGTNLSGPTVDLDQSVGSGIDLANAVLSSTITGQTPGKACIQISGTAPANAVLTFVKTDGCTFEAGDTSVAVLGARGDYRYSAVGGWDDRTTHGPYASAALPPVDTLFNGRIGPWQEVAAAAPWSGTVHYRYMGEPWVELKGAVQYSGTGSGPILTLQTGYRPVADARVMPTATSVGVGVATISPTGEVTVSPVGATALPAGATVNLDGINFPIDG